MFFKCFPMPGSKFVALQIHQRQGRAPHAFIVEGCKLGLQRVRIFVVRLPAMSWSYYDSLIASFQEEQEKEGFSFYEGDFAAATAEGRCRGSMIIEGSCVLSRNSVPAVERQRLQGLGCRTKSERSPVGSYLSSLRQNQVPKQAVDNKLGQPKGNTRMESLAKYFHLPINSAGKQLGICPTVLKKICRKNGLQRWPHRKLRSIDRLLEKLQSTAEEAKLPSTVCLHAGDLINRIESLKKERAELCFST